MKNKTIILHYIPGFNYGGIEQRFISWYKKLDKTNFKFELLVNAGSKSELLDHLSKLGVKIHEIPPIGPLTIIKHKSFLSNFFENNFFDAIHCHSPDKSYYVLKYAKKYRIPIRILHARTSQLERGKGLYLKKYYKKKTPNYATNKLAVSKVAGDWLFDNTSGEYEVIKNAIELDKYKYNHELRLDVRKKYNIEGKLVIGHVGRFTYAKNHIFLITLFSRINFQYPNSILLLVGDGPLYDDIKAHIDNLNLSSKVIFTGYSKETELFYPAMDLFLFPSIYEGLPGTLVEAQASGLNCIISNTISDEAIISNNVKVCSLESDFDEWINAINFTESSNREVDENLFTKKGYNLDEVVNNLQKVYTKVDE